MKKKAFFTRSAATLLLLTFLVGLIMPVGTGASQDKRFEISADYGYGNVCRYDKYCPFRITVKNNGDDFEGSVELALYDPDGALVAHDKRISLTAGASKTVNLVCLNAERTNSFFSVRILDRHNKTIYSENFVLKVPDPDTTVSVGVLSDDFNAMSYLSGKSLIGAPNFTTRLFKLDASTMPEDFLALDMLDVIVVSNFSTDSLSDAQLSALMNWVSNGGLLMTGTGDSASKTLSGLQDYISIKTGELRSVNTTFGSGRLTYTYDYTVDSASEGFYYVYDTRVQYVMKQIALGDYLKEFEDDPQGLADTIDYERLNRSLYDPDAKIYPVCIKIYEENQDLFTTLWDLYFGESYTSFISYADPSQLESEKMWFQEFCENQLIMEMLRYYVGNILITLPAVKEENGPAVAKVLDISFGETIIPGDDIDTGKDYCFASYAPVGKGYISLFAVDLTKTPFVNSPDNHKLILHVIESLIGQTISDRSYYWRSRQNGDWYVSDLTNKLSSASMIPIAAYILILFGYTVAAFVIYFRLRKKNKTSKIWGTQAILAMSTALLIFLLSFTTRIISPRVTSATIVTDFGGKVTKKTYASVLLPKIKGYNINFSENFDPALSYSNSGNSYYSSSSPVGSNEEIYVAFRDKPGVSSVSINSPATMSTVPFILTDKKYTPTSGIDFEADYSNGTLTGHVTNNTGETLENAFVCINYVLYRIDTMLPGQTVDLSTLEGYTFIDIDRSTGKEIYARSGNMQMFDYSVSAASVLFGTGNGKFKKEYNKRALYSYILEEYLTGYTGLYSNIFFDSYIYTSKGGEYYKKIVPEQPSLEAALKTLGLTAQGFPKDLYIAPCFVAFSKDAGSVLEKRGHSESAVKVYVVRPDWGNSSIPYSSTLKDTDF